MDRSGRAAHRPLRERAVCSSAQADINNSKLWVTRSTGVGFGPPTQRFTSPFYGTMATLEGDVTGDGFVDLIAVNSTSTWELTSEGTRFHGPTLWSSTPFYGSRA